MSIDAESAAFVSGVINASDLARVTGTNWIIASGMSSASNPTGHLYLVDTKRREAEVLFPRHAEIAPDIETYGSTPAPTAATFAGHGLALRSSPDGLHTLYVTNHVGREAVEVFQVDARGDKPVISWQGAVVFSKDQVYLADVAPHPDGGFVAVSMCDGLENLYGALDGNPSGGVWRWTPGTGGPRPIPGASVNGPHGVEVSPDGRRCFINCMVAQEIRVLSLSGTDPWTKTIQVDLYPNNSTWSQDGRHLLIAGPAGIVDWRATMDRIIAADQISTPFKVVRLNVDTLELEELLTYDRPGGFGLASTALEVGDELWVSSARSDEVAVFRAGLSTGRV
jgi:hypothetical protein